mmetsp:Transcript_9768/g.26117  ORF Transcript_9768/g.26117 Transcript_9768/m.26117 type:complete len:398 (-) Transcript_9768:344-1537(-)
MLPILVLNEHVHQVQVSRHARMHQQRLALLVYRVRIAHWALTAVLDKEHDAGDVATVCGVVEGRLPAVVQEVHPLVERDVHAQGLQAAQLRGEVDGRVAVTVAQRGGRVVHVQELVDHLVRVGSVVELRGVVQAIAALGVAAPEDRLRALAQLGEQSEDLAKHACLDRIDNHIPPAPVENVQIRSMLDDRTKEPLVLLVHRQHDGRAPLAVVRIHAGIGFEKQIRHRLVLRVQRPMQRRSKILVRGIHRAAGSKQELHGIEVIVARGVVHRRLPVLVLVVYVRLPVEQAADCVHPPVPGRVGEGRTPPLVGQVDLKSALRHEPVHHDQLYPIGVIPPDREGVHAVRQPALARWEVVLLVARLTSTDALLQSVLEAERLSPDLLALSTIGPGDEVHKI